jgi:hypothetical protein
MTSALGWTLARSPAFSSALLAHLGCPQSNLDEVAIRLQESEPPYGITDIELELANRMFAILEAKRGWVLPSAQQLLTYARRQKFLQSGAPLKKIVVLSECTTEYAASFLQPKAVAGIPVESIAWREVLALIRGCLTRARGAERSVLADAALYLGRLVTVQPVDSNLVYVVSLSRSKIGTTGVSFTDIVSHYGQYFHALGINGWPKEPPNYIAFRLDGRLQTIHHIESYSVIRSAGAVSSELSELEWEYDHLLYRLGPGFGPSHAVLNGPIWPNGRYWCMLDTLFTCTSIAEARDETQRRFATVSGHQPLDQDSAAAEALTTEV